MTSAQDPGTAAPAAGATKYPPPPPETPAERKGRLIALIVMPFLMVTMMYATYMGTMHDPKPRDLPVAVVGQGAAAEAFADELAADHEDTLEVRVLDDAASAEELIAEQEIAGAIELPAAGSTAATIHVAMATGGSQASVVQQQLTPAALAQGWTVQTSDSIELGDGDGTGTLVLFAAMGMMLAGYVPLSGLLLGTPNLLRVRRFLPISLGWSVLTSSLIWLVLGPVLGVVEGHYPLFLGVGTLAVMAVITAQLLFTKVMGPLAVLLGMLLFVVLGMPSSNLAMSIHTMPEFFQWLHQALPLPAAGEALRSALYLDGHGLAKHLGVLAAWVVVALGLATLKERKDGGMILGGPLYTEPDAPLPALAGGPVAPYRRRLAAVALFPLTIMLTVVTVMGLSMHDPKIQDMPVAVVGPAAQAEQMVAAMQPQMGDMLELSTLDSVEQAREEIEAQELVAAYVLPTAAGEPVTVLTAGGAGTSQQTAAQQMLAGVAAGSDMAVETVDVAPLTEDDANGSNSMYVGMAWIMAGFLMFAVLRGGAPDLRRTRDLMPMVAGWSVGISVWLWFLFDVLIGAVNGHALELIGYGALTVFTVGWASSVFVRLFGMFMLVPVMIVVMLAGIPASGGGLSVYMAPTYFQPLADILPLPAAIDLVRSVTYFDGVGVGQNVLVLVIWGGVGLLLNLLVVDRFLNRPNAKPPAPMGPRYQPERKPKRGSDDAGTPERGTGSDAEPVPAPA